MQIADFDASNNLVELFLRRADELGDKPFLTAKARRPMAFAELARSGATGSACSPNPCAASASRTATACCWSRRTAPSGRSPTSRSWPPGASPPRPTPPTPSATTRTCSRTPAPRAVIVSDAKLAKPLLPAVVHTGIAEHVIGMEPLRCGQSALRAATQWADLLQGDAGAARAGGRRAHRRDRPARSRVHHLHQRHQRAPARGAAPPRGDPAQRRRCGRSARRRLRLGRRTLPLVPAAEPRARAHRRAVPADRPRRGDLVRRRPRQAREQHRGMPADLHDRRPAAVRDAARADRQAGREAGQARPASCSTARSRWPSARPPASSAWPTGRSRGCSTRRCGPKYASASAGRSRRSSPAARRSIPRSARSSNPSGWSCSRATARPKARRSSAATFPRRDQASTRVGPPLRGVEVRIAEDGEILVRGELVMLGYWRNEEETAKTIVDGWLHTGDIGHFDDKGRIVITDRKKDIIVNDKGDNIAPQKLEGMLTLQPRDRPGDGQRRQPAVHRRADRARCRLGSRLGQGQRRALRPRRAAAAPRLPRRDPRGARPGQPRLVGDREGPPVRLRRRAVHRSTTR